MSLESATRLLGRRPAVAIGPGLGTAVVTQVTRLDGIPYAVYVSQHDTAHRQIITSTTRADVTSAIVVPNLRTCLASLLFAFLAGTQRTTTPRQLNEDGLALSQAQLSESVLTINGGRHSSAALHLSGITATGTRLHDLIVCSATESAAPVDVELSAASEWE